MTKKTTSSTRRRQTSKTNKDLPPTTDASKLPDQLKELRLPTFRDNHLPTAQTAARDNWSHIQFLADLVEKECQSRAQSRIQRLMRNANLLAGKTWDQLDWSRLPLHVTQQFETLRHGDFLNRQDNLLIFGKPGSGKTMLLSALGDQLVKQGRAVCFSTCQMLVQELLRAKRDLRLERFIKKLQKFEALIIDDLGYVQQSREEMDLIHASLGTLRARQCAPQLESAVLQMGSDLQGPHDDRSSDRPADPSLGHHRTQHTELPPRGGDEEEATSADRVKGWIKNLGGFIRHGHSNCR